MLLYLQAKQIVAKLFMNMAAVDKRLAEEQNRQAMVSEYGKCDIWCICILHEFKMMQHCWNNFAEYS